MPARPGAAPAGCGWGGAGRQQTSPPHPVPPLQGAQPCLAVADPPRLHPASPSSRSSIKVSGHVLGLLQMDLVQMGQRVEDEKDRLLERVSDMEEEGGGWWRSAAVTMRPSCGGGIQRRHHSASALPCPPASAASTGSPRTAMPSCIVSGCPLRLPLAPHSSLLPPRLPRSLWSLPRRCASGWRRWGTGRITSTRAGGAVCACVCVCGTWWPPACPALPQRAPSRRPTRHACGPPCLQRPAHGAPRHQCGVWRGGGAGDAAGVPHTERGVLQGGPGGVAGGSRSGMLLGVWFCHTPLLRS